MADKAKPKAGRPRRIVRNISVEPDDASVLKWIEQQKKLSESVRELIIDEIERNGYTDRHFREVVQVPQPVFPGLVPFAAGQAAAQGAAVEDAADAAGATEETGAAPSPETPAEERAAASPAPSVEEQDDDGPARPVAEPDMLDEIMNGSQQ